MNVVLPKVQVSNSCVVILLAMTLRLLMVVVGLVDNKVRRGTIMKERGILETMLEQ